MVSYIFFLFALLAYAIASEMSGESSNSFSTGSLTVAQMIAPTSSMEPEIPPAEWPTKFVSGLVPVTSIMTSTLPTTRTKTFSGHLTVEPVQTDGVDTVISSHTTCSYQSAFQGSNTTYTCHKTPKVVTSVYTTVHTITTEDCGYEPNTSDSVSSTSSTPTYSCDPRVNLSCLTNLYTSTTTGSSSHGTTSTDAVDPVSHSTISCQQTSSTMSFKTSTARSTFSASPESLSGSSQSSSITTCSSTHGTSASSSFHPTSSSSSSPVTAGSNVLRPNMKMQVLTAPFVFAFAVWVGTM
ncbi:hypothetical protein BJ166DRAFT_493933 [Pestalotiopsis sp. NC0098]|nr:hypothetical protein BJ166DRAFT_493933 [Pestalotiopsis sp. NC0098]